MPSTKELRGWLLVSLVLLGVLRAWGLVDPVLWPTRGTPEEMVRHLQRHARFLRYGLGVFAGVVLCGMTRWVYWALCKALAPAKHEVCALHPRDAQALRDFCTRGNAEDTEDDWEG
jgi:hypothetical protein